MNSSNNAIVSKAPFILIFLVIFLSACKTTSVNGPETEAELLKSGYKKVLRKDYTGAVLIYSKILDSNPANAEAFAYRGLCKFHLHDFQGSLQDFNYAIQNQSDYAEAYDLRGVVRAELGDREGACDDWKKAYELGLKDAFSLIKEFCWEE